MKKLLTLVSLAGLFAAAGFADAPSISTIVNAASLAQAPLPNSPIAQGSFFSIFGSGLGPSAGDCGAGFAQCLWNPYPLQTTIKGVSVTVTIGKSAPVTTYLYF